MSSVTQSDRRLIPTDRPNNQKYELWSVAIIAALVAAVYATMFGNYRANLAIDTQWDLSFSYNYCMKGIDTDATFGLSFPNGMGGTVAFGKLAAMVQCAALAPFNWSLVAANILSVAGVMLSMAVIFAFLVNQGFSRFAAAMCCLALAATEPFVAMANQSKYEYITFLLAACSLLLLARGHLLLAGLVSVLAIEAQPIGIMAPIYLVSFELSRMIQTRRSFRFEFDRIAKLALGGALGVAVYFALHPHILTLLAAFPNPEEWGKQGSIHFLYGYFFEARLYRHLPELAIFVACLVVHVWRRDYMQWPFPIIASFAALFIGFFIGHNNYFYTPFWYFPSFLLVFLTISIRWRAVAVPAFVLLLFVPQYAVAYVEGHKYARQDELQVARWAIASRGTDLSRAHIFGDSIFWPVFKDLSFQWAPTALGDPQALPHGTIYLICGLDQPFYPFEHACADELPALGERRLVDQFSWAGRKYQIYERRNDAPGRGNQRTGDGIDGEGREQPTGTRRSS
jgi:hypothetical protein